MTLMSHMLFKDDGIKIIHLLMGSISPRANSNKMCLKAFAVRR